MKLGKSWVVIEAEAVEWGLAGQNLVFVRLSPRKGKLNALKLYS